MTAAIDIGTLIVSTAGICGGRPRIAGRRLSVQQIAVLYREGLNPEEIAREYEFLTLAQVYAALTYDRANTEEIERYLREEKAAWTIAWKVNLVILCYFRSSGYAINLKEGKSSNETSSNLSRRRGILDIGMSEFTRLS